MPSSPEHFNPLDKTPTSDSIQKDFSRLFGIDVFSLEFPEEEVSLVTEDLADSFSRTNASPEEKAEYLFGLRRDLQTALSAEKKQIIKDSDKNISNADIQTKILLNVVNNPDLRAMLIAYRTLLSEEDTTKTVASGFSRHREEKERINGTFEEYAHYRKDLARADQALNSILSEIFHERETTINKGKLIRLSIAEKRVDHLENLLKTIQKQNPFTAAQIEYEKITDYSQQLRENGFIWTESRRTLFRATLKKAQSDRQMVVLFGETGTGKTSFTRAVSKELSGKEPLRTVGGPEDPFRRLLATQTVDGWNFGPLLYAMTGLQNSLDHEPKHSGAIYFDDEFNTRPTAIQRQIMKFVSEAKPGRALRVPGPDFTITVQPGFLYIAAGNPPSIRYEREEVGIETQREFSGNIINYGYMEQSPENPELHQILLGAIMDENSKRITIAGKEELSPSFTKKNGQETLDTNPTSGGFLWRFANLWHDLNTAFTQGNQKDKSKIQKTALQLANPSEPLEAFELSEFNLDPGKVLGWIDSFKRSPKIHQSMSLPQYLSEQLKDSLEMATEEDASVLQKYLKFYNLEYAENKYPIQQKTILTHQDIGFLSPNVPRPREEQEDKKPEPEIPSIETSVIINEAGEDIYYFSESFGNFPIGRRFERKQETGRFKKKKGDATHFILVGWTTDNIMQTSDKNSIVFEERKIVLQESAKKTGITVTQRELEEGFEAIKNEIFITPEKAREYGLTRLELPAFPEAQKLINAIIPDQQGNVDIDIETPAGKTEFVQRWTRNCPNLPMPCVSSNDFWYLTQLKNGKIIANVANISDTSNPSKTLPNVPCFPSFGQETVLYIMDWTEEDWDAKNAKNDPKTKLQNIQSKLLDALLLPNQHKGVVNVKREDIDTALWKGDPYQRIQTDKHKNILEDLGLDPSEIEIRCITQDEYARGSITQGWGKKNLWTNYDGFFGGGVRNGLPGGYRDYGGPSLVGRGSRGDMLGGLAVRLVLTRKQ